MSSWSKSILSCPIVRGSCAVRLRLRRSVSAARQRGHDGGRREVERAAYVAVGEAVSLSAECLVWPEPLRSADTAALREIALRQLRASAAHVRLTIEAVEQPDAGPIALRGSSEAGRDARNEPLLRIAEARVHVGPRSMLILWAWAMLPTERRMPEIARRFLDGTVAFAPIKRGD